MENPKSLSEGDVPSMLHSNSQESAYNVSCLLWVLDLGLGLRFRVRLGFRVNIFLQDFWNRLLLLLFAIFYAVSFLKMFRCKFLWNRPISLGVSLGSSLNVLECNGV